MDDASTQAVDLLIHGVVRPSVDWLDERPLSAGPLAFAELVDGKAKATLRTRVRHQPSSAGCADPF
jgi:hypothetical protein